MPREHSWVLQNFPEALDAWVALERPPPDLLILVTAWGLNLIDDPYVCGRRADGFEDLFFAIIPGTGGGSLWVTCSYFVDGRARVIRCSHFGYQSLPFGR